MNSIDEKRLSEAIDMIQLKIIRNIYDPIRTMVAIKGMKFLELDANERRVLATLCYIGEGTVKIIMTYLPGLPYITVASIINKLVKEGYVEKYKKENSKKNNYIRASELGQKITQQYDDAAIDCSRYLYNRYLNEEEMKDFLETSERYLKILEKLEDK